MKINYAKIYSVAAEKGGWSGASTDTSVKWPDIYEEFTTRLNGTEVVLDIRTAEGNKFLRLSSTIKKGVGIDAEAAMIKLANKICKEKGIANMEFLVMDSDRLKFDDNTFDCITCQHAPINFAEAFRVLKMGGILVTQQVDERDKINLKKAFQRGQGYQTVPHNSLLAIYEEAARNTGFKKIHLDFSNKPNYFKNEEALLEFLIKTPTIPNFGNEEDQKILRRFIAENTTSNGIESNTARFLLTAIK